MVWLEDDWVPAPAGHAARLLSRARLRLARSRVSFNPGIWSRALFREAIYDTLAPRSPEQVDDPETLCADPLNAPGRYRTLDVFVDPRFQDAGRAWSAAAGLQKWHQDATGLCQRGSVSYVGQRRPGAATGAPDSDIVLCPARLLGGNTRVLARLRRQSERLGLEILGVPFVRFELVPTAGDEAPAHTVP